MLQAIGNEVLALAQAFVLILPQLVRDIAGISAVASISYGSSMLHPAAGYIVGGVLVLAGVVLTSAAQISNAGMKG